MSNQGGRPPHQPDDKSRTLVESLSGLGIVQDDIARLVGISANTLREHYRAELDLGAVKANAKVAQNLFAIACKPTREGLDAAKFWLRVRAGWSEYAPPSWRRESEESAPMLGKKAQAQADAETAHEGTEWGALLRH